MSSAISFSECIMIHLLPPREESESDLFYKPEEIEKFRQEAIEEDLCFGFSRRISLASSSLSSSSHPMSETTPRNVTRPKLSSNRRVSRPVTAPLQIDGEWAHWF